MDKFIDKVQKDWVLIAFAVSMVMWFANTNSRLATVEKAQADQVTVNDKIDQLVLDTALIRQDVGYIKEKIK